jgi:predicted Fe-S protein YdhL (DUF1289 family)
MSATPPPSDSVASPCVRNCCLDDDNVCLGCGRTLDEIIAWSTAGDADKRAILDRCRERAAERQQRRDAWTLSRRKL